MRILILGGTRFIGLHMTSLALERGHTLTFFNRGKTHTDKFPEIAEAFLPLVLEEYAGAGVTVHGDPRVAAYSDAVVPATEQDWGTEYLSADISVAIVDSLEDALDHIRRYGTGHTEAIVSESVAATRRFAARVDAAAVMVNASTRFTDGGEFGFGAEIGISTQKLHARGPMGLPELTSTKYIITGDGHTRG